jgi:glycosyltransferase involved in cell wall biosynthesis
MPLFFHMIKLSICIPTYNRATHLANCLNSIRLMQNPNNIEFEVCVSNNCSIDNTEEVVINAQGDLPIKYSRNDTNLGIPRNFLNVVEMASGEFAWLIGDDDLLLPDSLIKLHGLLSENPDVDFFYVNSFHLDTEFVSSFSHPFDTANLPQNMSPFSTYKKNGRLQFLDLIDPEVSFDFLGGMFLSVFRRNNWMNNVDVLNPAALKDMRTFSYFDNTFPHIKIFSKAFANSSAYFNTDPLSVCLSGVREWSPMYPFVHSIRLVEALEEYHKNGLGFFKYLGCRNFALNSFIPDLVSMYINREISGIKYVNPFKIVFSNCLFPNFYFSVIYYFIRKFKYIVTKKHD